MSYTLKLEWPYTGTIQETVTIQAPELGDSTRSGRKQTVRRLRSGASIVYDGGLDLDQRLRWDFRNITDTERAALLFFLAAVGWAQAKIKATDWNGQQRIVRILSPNIEAVNSRMCLLDGGAQSRLWDFSLEVLDLTDNTAEFSQEDVQEMSTALGLHIADEIDEHSPREITLVDDADGAVVIDSVSIASVRSVVWVVQASNGTKNAIALAYGSTDRNYDTPADATAVKDATDFEWHESGTEVSAEVTLSMTVTGAGTAQVINLTADVSTDGWRFVVRRNKLQ